MDNRLREFRETYEVLGKIGKGGGGTVFKAYHKRLQKEVVLKKIHSNLKNINTRTETDILKNLKHAYLPQVLDFLEVGGNTFTVMDYIQGESLKECLDEGRTFTQAEIIVWFKQLCEALELLHAQNPPIIHGDIKPANIMLTPEKNICLIDFNIASIFEGKNTTVSGYTPGYAAPEQIQYYKQIQRQNQQTHQLDADGMTGEEKNSISDRGIQAEEETIALEKSKTNEHIFETEAETELLRTDSSVKPWENWREDAFRATVDVRTDIYSLGATIYHLLSGSKPRKGKEPIRDIREAAPQISEPLAYIVTKCMAEKPEERYQSVSELYQALQNIYKSSKQYQRLLARQRAVRLGLCVGMMGFIAVAIMGNSRMRQEKDIEYLKLVKQEEELWDGHNEDSRDMYFEQAIALYPERADAYQVKAKEFYEQRQYEETIQFLTEVAVPYVTPGSGLANLYLLIGNSYLALERYEEAENALMIALENDGQNSAIYRDLAVIQARAGNVPEAELTLQSAVEHGLADDGISYTEGEILYAQGNDRSAEEAFREAILWSDDDYMKMRAYLMCAKIKENQTRTAENCEERINLLEEAQQTLPMQYQNAVLEQLAQAYMDFADFTGNQEASLKAADIMQKMIDYGWDSYVTHQNLAVLYQKNRMFDEEYQELQYMLDLYGEDYRTYKCLAFMELQKQEETTKDNRDYAQFDNYYQRAVALYEEQKETNQSDADMESLEHLYEEVRQGGWF